MNEFKISEKVTKVISDNAANMVKAFSLPGFKSSDPDLRKNDIALDSESDVESDLLELDEEENDCFHVLYNLMDVLQYN